MIRSSISIKTMLVNAAPLEQSIIFFSFSVIIVRQTKLVNICMICSTVRIVLSVLCYLWLL